VPTTAEAGVKGADSSLWIALWGPAGMKPDLVNKINADVRKALADPGVKSKLESLGNSTMELTPAQFAKLVREETDENKRLLAAAGVKPQ
jgi:tripartite-type tricarboxylate transporter receptor subunit TctC